MALVGLNATAADLCQDKSQFRIEYSRCLDAELETAQRTLTTWENDHLFRLQELEQKTGRGDPLKVFKRSRQLFKQFSVDHCRWQYLALVPDSQAGSAAYKACMIDQLQIQSEILSKISY